MKRRKPVLFIALGVLSLFISSMACSLIDVETGGTSENDLAATQISIQSTQLALEAMQLQYTQEAMTTQQESSPVQEPAPPEQQNAQQPEPQPAAPDVFFDGVSLSYDDSLGRDVSTRVEPSDLVEDPYWGTPEHIEFEFVGYPVENDYHRPQVFVFPVDAYRAANENVDDKIDRLQSLLQSRPANPDRGIPLLPAYNAGELGWAKVAYFDFQNGSGVRFVTQLGQAEWPFYNGATFYTYQGLTSDGRYYVSVIMPLTHPSLNEYDNYQAPDNFFEIAGALLDNQVADLNSQPDESYFPNIAVLDAMVQSLNVAK